MNNRQRRGLGFILALLALMLLVMLVSVLELGTDGAILAGVVVGVLLGLGLGTMW
jgi:hypothetical protein